MAHAQPPGTSEEPRRRPDQALHLLRMIRDAVPGGPTRQFTALSLLERHLDRVPVAHGDPGPSILDFGAGSGDRLPELRQIIPTGTYTGIDLHLPAEPGRHGPGVRFVEYDGTRMPFEDGSFDLCFSKQVLEHVRHPDAVIAEIARTLRPKGVFVGSVSFLEPYHSRSIFNWTPYGLVTVLEDHGFTDIELRPGIDGASMIFRILYGVGHFAASFGQESGFNHHIDTSHASESRKLRNARKLVVTGHLCFIATKGESGLDGER